jgi:hypothetical protein
MADMTGRPAAFTDAAPGGSMLRPRNVLIVVAILEVCASALRLHVLFGDPSGIPGTVLGEALSYIYLVAHPLLALAALAFAAIGRVHYAIIALASIVALAWPKSLLWLLQSELDFDWLAIQWITVQIFVFPIMVACAVALVVRQLRLGLATALVSIPTVHGVVSFLVYIVFILINGL